MRYNGIVTSLLCLAAALAFAAPEPALELKLNDGKFDGLACTGTIAGQQEISVSVANPGLLEWVDGRAEESKALYFNRNLPKDAKRGTIGSVVIGNRTKDGKPVIDFTKPFTVMFWMQQDKDSERSRQYEVFSTARGDRGPGLRVGVGWDSFRVSSGDGKKSWAIAIPYAKCQTVKGNWSHVAFSWDGTAARLYINGIKFVEKSGEEFPSVTRGENNMYVGSYRGGYAYGFTGIVSDVKVYTSALGDAEILSVAKNLDGNED